MKTYTPRQLRSAILLTVALTSIAILALLDPSCRRGAASSPPEAARSPGTR